MRSGLAANAKAITGLICLPYTPDSVTPPMFFVAEYEIDFDRAFGRGLDELTATCRVLVSHATDKQAQAKLDQYLTGGGPRSLKAALQSDRTLGGACDDSRVTRVFGYGLYEHGTSQFFGAQLSVHVIGSGA
ncbi:hypothetical protein AMETH_6330 [Amycolatopsis methanolica 239]|uniref:Uncharacterized protein n=1 Tax=Amycolatopsis methanolica 239 TaxID=1068978 RepID=A0A076N8M4_AMYME|nr:hypothetical protein AMETH_6271 [Amycolatopsis methanolica 239]AIJ26422.1 hypothetical protein AMETH_6330 [Amycolatopsis methanolica 239]